MCIEHDFLHVHFGPANSQAVEKSKILVLHKKWSAGPLFAK
jgi:hypothetical protein